ncbi:MAG TPA: YqeG family HAD IIIA-type phosphatase [Desulfobacteria bacterium]|nr:YqeG family HAD IIIA-type phosphatase [Desulfobacteria bacterium]
MLRKFYPKAYISSLAQIGPDYFLQKGIKGVILDLDNTIIPWRSGVMEPYMSELLNTYLEAGLKLCVVSNALSNRVERLLKPIGIPGIARAVKPRRKAFMEALQILGTADSETAVVGDQIFTDILGGNRLGLYTVLVVPISKREFLGTRLVRIIEKTMINRLSKRGVVEIPDYDKKNL